MNKKGLYIFDFDETIVDDYWFEHVNTYLRKLGRKPITSHLELTSRFYAEEEVFTDPNELKAFWAFLEKQQLYKNSKPREGAWTTLYNLNKNNDVLIATAVPTLLSKKFQEKEASAKMRFIQSNFPFLNIEKQLLFINDKSKLSGTSITDDALSNLKGNFDKKLLFTAHHNRNETQSTLDDRNVQRVNNWREVAEALDI